MKKNTILFIVITAMILIPLSSWAACKWCGRDTYGRGCPNAPNKVHEHVCSSSECKWCGHNYYGKGCTYAPNKIHQHGSGDQKCTWCGHKNVKGKGCTHSPTKVHEM